MEQYNRPRYGTVSVAMDGDNGHADPLDSLIQSKQVRLLNINNLKLARFIEFFLVLQTRCNPICER
ncbi:MAG: hypothetical protein O7D86_04295 [Proteobacteria bacterium]|nr:hypothetical protein [Pseudomonadota bacterium]